MNERHIISLIVENKFGVLAKVAGLFSIRGYNIDSFSVGRAEDETLSRMTIAVRGDTRTIEQITKQLHKLIDVVTVFETPERDRIERELCFIRVHTAPSRRAEITHLAELAGARVTDVAASSILFEITDTEEKVNAFLELMRPFGIKKLVRGGIVAIERN